MKTAAAYLRVSTDKQDEYSLDSQLKLIRDYAARNDCIVPDEFVFCDDGISGRIAAKRPEFRRMIALAKEKERPFEAILVWKFSRFARNQEESIVYKSMLARSGVELTNGDGISLLEWLLSFLPVYAAALPLGYLVLRRVPTDAQEGTKPGVKRFVLYLLACYSLMYIGSLADTLLASLLSGGSSENVVNAYAMDSNPIKMLVIVLLAPLFEEWFLRRQLIDRSVRYGEKTAIVFSALAFTLFHRNIHQFFSVFWIGLVLGYVYVRTRRLRYTVLLHMIVNFMGSVLAPLALSGLDTELLEQLQAGTLDEAALMSALPQLGALMAFGLLIVGLVLAGLIVLLVHIRRLEFHEAELELERKGRFKTVYVHAGTILFFLLCTGGIVISIVR